MFPGYVYISMNKELDSDANPLIYRPDIGNDIWNGLLSVDAVTPSGAVWDEFAQRVIDEYQDPIWDPYPQLPPNSPISSVTSFAGHISL